MIWWGWLIPTFCVGAVLAAVVSREVALYSRTKPRAITIDLVGARPARDPDD